MNQVQRSLSKSQDIPSDLNSVWRDWTTRQGLESFFAPKAAVELIPNGKFELYFMLDATPGFRGSEGCKILNFIERKVLFFTWNNPPHLTEIRAEQTYVMLQFFVIDNKNTQLKLTHYGWAEGGQWDEAFDYFDKAWSKVLKWHCEKYSAPAK